MCVFLRQCCLLSVSLLFAGCWTFASQRGSPTPADEPQPSEAFDARALERLVHDEVNRVRRAASLPELTWDDALANLAASHSREMAATGRFDHLDARGNTPHDRAQLAGIRCGRTTGTRTYSGVGENLFYTHLYSAHRTIYTVPDAPTHVYDWKREDELAREIVTGWMDSPPHRENIMARHYEAQGLGIARAGGHRIYVTQNLC